MPFTSVTTGWFEGYTVDQLERLILWELGQISGTTVTYSRFPKWLIRQKLTEKQNEFVSASHCLKKFCLCSAKENYRAIKLPYNMVDGGVVAVKYFSSSTDYKELEIVDTYYLDERVAGWVTAEAAPPEKCYMEVSYGNVQMLGLYPKPDVDGTDYATDIDTGVSVGVEYPGATNNVPGVATGGNAGGTTLVDTNVIFTNMGLVPGMYVRNTSDGSYAYILTIAANTLTFASALSGGTLNKFTAGNSYLILAGEYGVLTSFEYNDRILFGSDIGALETITIPAGNIYVDYVPLPMPFSFDPTALDSAQGNDNQYPEIPKMYHQALAMGVVGELLKTFNEKTKEFARGEYYKGLFNEALSRAMAKKESRPFKHKPSAIHPKMRR